MYFDYTCMNPYRLPITHTENSLFLGREYLPYIDWKPSCHDVNFVVIGSTTGCHYDNLWCRQWRRSWRHDILVTILFNPFIQSPPSPLRWRQNGHDGVSNHQPHDCLLNRLFRRRSKKTSKLRVTGLCAWNSPVTGEFPAQMASNGENVSIWWHHHATPTPPTRLIIITLRFEFLNLTVPHYPAHCSSLFTIPYLYPCVLDANCHYWQEGDSGTVESGTYEDNANCRWTLVTTPDKRIKLEVSHIFW